MTTLLICFIGALLGIMLFFAASVAPTAFRKLPPEHAGTYIRSIFPLYYIWGIVLAVTSAVLAVSIDTRVLLITTTVAVLFVFSRQLLVPLINSARDARLAGEEGADARFKRLHLASVLINLLQMLLLLVAAWMLSHIAR